MFRREIKKIIRQCTCALLFVYLILFIIFQNSHSNLDNHQILSAHSGKIMMNHTSYNENITLWGLGITHGNKQPAIRYLDRYKNPCWKKISERAAATVRCLPYFYLLGVGKSGTTTLYTQLIKHPDIVPAKHKELFFWNLVSRRKLFSKYLDMFSDASAVIHNYSDSDGYHRKITLDATPAYFTNHGMLSMIPGNDVQGRLQYTLPHTLYTINPHTKFVVLLRNPTDRLYSHYKHFHNITGTAEEFHQLATNGIKMMSNCLRTEPLRRCAFDYKLNREIMQGRHLFLHYSMYYPYALEWLDVFPPEQILFIRSEEFVINPIPVMKQLFSFLSLEQLPETTYSKIKDDIVNTNTARNTSALLQGTRMMLDNFFRPLNRKLATFLKHEKFLFSK